MFGRPELLFNVKLRPYGSEGDTSDFEIPLVYFSAFERTKLTPRNPMQSELGCIPLYGSGPWPSKMPIMHVGLVSNVLCRAPLVPCFIEGNQAATIPHSLRHLQHTQFRHGRAGSRPDKGDGSRLYEVNQLLWNFGKEGQGKLPLQGQRGCVL